MGGSSRRSVRRAAMWGNSLARTLPSSPALHCVQPKLAGQSKGAGTRPFTRFQIEGAQADSCSRRVLAGGLGP